MVAPPDKSGLKGQWGVSDPQAPAHNTGSEQQRQEFTAAFQQEQATINGHLQYTAVNAEASENAGLASRRDALYASFQAASGKIDPNDAAKAQADIDRVLGEARALSAEAATLHQETEQAKQEWEGQQAPADDAVHRIEELETWEDKQAATLRGQADAIRGHVNERRWREACTALAALLPALEPVYQEYVRQRDAKPVYEQQAAEQTARLEPLKTAERPSQPMTAQAGEAEAALQAAQAKADAKDFVAGVEAMASVAAAVDALDAMANDTQRQQYLAATQPGAQVSELQPDPSFKTLEADWAAIAEAAAQAEPLAAAGDYAGANQALATQAARREQFQSKHDVLLEQKQSYEAALAALQPRLDALATLEPLYASLQPMQQALAPAQAQMASIAEAEDFANALVQLQDVTAKAGAIEAAKTEIDQKKQAYETALAAITPRLQAASMSEAQYARLQPLQQDIAAVQSTMEAAAQAGDYDKASQLLADLSAKLEPYERAKAELDEQKAVYEALRTRIDALVTAAAKKQYLNLAPKLEEIKKAQAQAAAASQVGDYAAATVQLNTAGAKSEAYIEAGKKEVEPAIMGEAQDARATAILKKLPEADQKEVQTLLDGSKSEAEKQYLLKGVAAGHSVAELKEFDKKVQGKDDTWLRDNLSVTGSSTGTGVQQQWNQSCNATAAQAVKAQMDPLYALKLHEENSKLDQVDTASNAKLAAEQKAGLESNYAGGVASGQKGVATPFGSGGAGRWADDLLNNQSDTTGITYATQKDPPIPSAMATIESGVSKGQPVPIVIGNSAGNYQHYVVVTGMTKGPPKQYTIHDPGSGKTVVRTEAQITGGAINLSNSNQITGIESPTAKAVPP